MILDTLRHGTRLLFFAYYWLFPELFLFTFDSIVFYTKKELIHFSCISFFFLLYFFY